MPLSWHRFPGRFSIIFLVLALLLLVLEHVNGRFWLHDFQVYYGAAEALLRGEPLYGVAHGLSSGVFKYAPAMAMLYVPFALLPYGLAASIQYGFIVIAFIGSVVLADKLLREHVFGGTAGRYALLFLTALVVAAHLHRELHLGNINVLLLWPLLLALDRLLRRKDVLAGALIGIVMLAKPHFVVLLPLLALRGRWKSCAGAIGVAVLGLLLPMALFGPHGSIELHREWLGEMAKHNSSMIYSGGDAYNSVDTVYSFLHRAILHYAIPQPSQLEATVILAVIALGFAALVWWNKWRERNAVEAEQHLLIEYILLVALVPSITLTDTNHFLLAMPLVMLIVHQAFARPEQKWLLFGAAPALLAFGGNWGDAIGSFSATMVHYGVLGVSDLALLLIGAILLLRARSNQSPPGSSFIQSEAHA